ncbi:hypothetical protein ACF06L_09095 [Streptomyces sp. NPDC015408]|uniref:hypothetical protein n=1 Tax=Streptomyces sp. NPDC015408 TaxID=3364956 RepID=UPI0036F73686
MVSVGREEDTRKVQTAVLGGPDGHRPLFLPYERQAAAQLRREHGSNAFTCGTLLGGCGKLLTLRACDDKKSHFAHRPPVRCSRTALGESSADHLYIGGAIDKWLRKQGQPNVSVQYVKQKGARSDAIEVRFGSKRKRRLIHVQMARRSFTEWQADGERLAAPAGKPSTIRLYGPESRLAPFELEVTGYALRFRCRTENGTRVVDVGTHPPGHEVTWTTLDKCRLAPAGILTPWLTETPYGLQPKEAEPSRSPVDRPTVVPEPEPPSDGSPEPQAGPLTGPVLPLMPGRVAFTGATLLSEANGRRVYDVDAQPLGSALFRARVSLPASTQILVSQHVYVLTQQAVVLEGPQDTGPACRWRLRAEGLVRLPVTKAAEWELLKPSVPMEKGPVSAATTSGPEQKSAPTTRAAEPDAQELPAGRTPGPTDVAPAPDDRLIAELGRVLVSTARERTTITWYELLKQTGTLPREVSETRQLRLLTALDAPHAKARRPLLSSLITFSKQAQPNDTPPPFFRQVLLGLGWPHWTDAAGAADVWRDHRQRLHRAHPTDRRVDGSPTLRTAAAASEGRRTVPRLEQGALVPLAAQVRTLLQDAARAGTTLTWGDLRLRLGGALPYLHPDDQGELLVMVDQQTRAEEPLLAALVTGADLSPHGLYRHVLRSHGRDRVPDESLETDWQMEVFRLYQLWRHR